MADTILLPLAEDLLACLCNELSLNPDPPAECCLRAGDLVIHDVDGEAGLDKVCCPGLAYVRIGPVFNSTEFPNPDVRNDRCLSLRRAVEFTIGVVRCVPGIGTPEGPSCPNWTLAATHDANDIDAIYKAVCCWTSGKVFNAMKGRRWANQVSTVSMQADCIERILPILIEIPKCC